LILDIFRETFGRVMLTPLVLLFWEWFKDALRLKGEFGHDFVKEILDCLVLVITLLIFLVWFLSYDELERFTLARKELVGLALES
jgi:hypothetical protein